MTEPFDTPAAPPPPDLGAFPERAPGDALRATLGLLAILLLALAPMTVRLGAPDSKRTMENITIASAQDTWIRQHGSARSGLEADPDAWLIPSRNGEPRVRKPPLVVWTHLLVWADLRPDQRHATPEAIITRGRFLAVGMGLLTILGTFLIAQQWGGTRLALTAAAVAATMLLTVRQARIASYDIHMVAFGTLAIAAGAWAMRPALGTPKLWRRILGWSLAGVALAAAVMSKNALPVVFALIAWGSMAALGKTCPKAAAIGTVKALAIAAALVVPWYLYAGSVVSDAGATFVAETRAARNEYQPPWYYLGLVALVAPWCMWLLGGLVLPFSALARPWRRPLLMAWVWFVAIFVVMSVPGAKQQRYIVPIVPAAALLIAQLWYFGQRLADRSHADPGINLLRIPHWVGLAAGAIGLPVVWLAYPDALGPMPAAAAVITAVALLAIAAYGTVEHFRWRPLRAAFMTALWAALAWSAVLASYSASPKRDHPIRPEAERVDAAIGDAPASFLYLPTETDDLNEEFLLYSQRIYPRLAPTDLTTETPAWLIADDTPANRAIVAAVPAYTEVFVFNQDNNRPTLLYRLTP